jgi:CHAD domain-containing protein/HD superfamily phosphodiesterase
VKTSTKTAGLRYWMLRVLDECDKVAADFSADPVHDLRVALRRCRSMADGLIAMDPDPAWKAMKKAGKQLFQRLGDLRDVQIMMEWIEKLHPIPARAGTNDLSTLLVAGPPAHALFQQDQSQQDRSFQPDQVSAPVVSIEVSSDERRDQVAKALLDVLSAREREHKREAQAALEEFDSKQWRHWSKSLPARAARFRLGSALFKHLALERWTEARALHTRTLRNRSQVALHQLRIGIKRFRYIVENFLPEQHKVWSDDLKHVQDLLGEVHDLDVLWATALACHVFQDQASRRRWHALIREERERRVEGYREKMTGPNNLWQVWRAALPQGKQLKAIAERRTKLWAKALDPDFAHSERVARLAVELYDGLKAAGLLGSVNEANGRSSLQIAALLHDVGKAKKGKGHHKESFKLIQAHGTPLGLEPQDMKRAAIVARFHCGALPTKNHKALRDLLPNEQKIAIQLAAILRLANAFDAKHDGRIRRVRIENLSRRSALESSRSRKRSINGLPRKAATLAPNEALVIAAEGYAANSRGAQIIAAERYLLETLLRRPIIVRAMKS